MTEDEMALARAITMAPLNMQIGGLLAALIKRADGPEEMLLSMMAMFALLGERVQSRRKPGLANALREIARHIETVETAPLSTCKPSDLIRLVH